MANEHQLKILRQGTEQWNALICDEDCERDLSDADLRDAYLYQADLHKVNLRGANLAGATLELADLSEADLTGANLQEACLIKSFFEHANLTRANLRWTNSSRAHFLEANLTEADLRGANLSEARFTGSLLRNTLLDWATMINTRFVDTVIEGCRVYGVSVWDIDTTGAQQSSLIITAENQAEITVDSLDLAQFVYLIITNSKSRSMIDTLASKAVLILGRFTNERKPVLESLRDELRKRNYVPIIFDFTQPSTRDLTETVSILAHMSRFVIADLTDAKSIPQELQSFVPDLPSVPVQPILLASEREYSMFEHFRRFPWVLPTFLYEDVGHLLASVVTHVIQPSEARGAAYHASS